MSRDEIGIMDRYERRLHKFKRQNSMLMSNPKWVKFFTVMTEFPDIVCIVKFFMMPLSSHMHRFPPSYHIHETGIGDCCDFSNGPCRYEEIEWVLIPLSSECEGKIIRYNCNPNDILAKLSEKGLFPIEHVSSNSPCVINGVLVQKDSMVPRGGTLIKYTLIEYLVIKGYNPLTPPLPPQPRRGPRAKKKS